MIGAAGITGIFSKFLKQIQENVDNGQIKSWGELNNVVEDLALHLNDRYKDRAHGEVLEVLMAIKSSEKTAELYHVTSTGISEEITKIIAIGHGEPYGSLFLKAVWNRNKTMRETAILAVSILHIIYMQGLDTSVNSLPQIWYIPFEGDIHKADNEDRDKITQQATQAYEEITSYLDGFTSRQKQTDTLKQ